MTTFYVVRAKHNNVRWKNWGIDYGYRLHGEWRKGEYLTLKQGFKPSFGTARFFDTPAAARKNLKTSNEVTTVPEQWDITKTIGLTYDTRRMTDSDIAYFFDIIPIDVPEPS